MKKIIMISVAIFVVTTIMAGSATGSLTYLGKFNPPANPDNIMINIETTMDNDHSGHNFDWNSLALYAKSEFENNAWIYPNEGTNPVDLTIAGSGSSGSWNTSDPVNFISFKAGQKYDIYWLNPADSSGNWSTSTHLESKDISNFNTFTVSQVPIPGAAWLLGSALFGLLAFRRRLGKSD